jgi:hypothetical protein
MNNIIGYCATCNKSFYLLELYERHFDTQKHKRRLEKKYQKLDQKESENSLVVRIAEGNFSFVI